MLLYAIANCISLASGYNPDSLRYTGDLRSQFLSMLGAGELKMFLFEPQTEKNEMNFCTMTVTSNGQEMKPVPEIRHSYDAMCHCGYPETWGNCVECDTCLMLFHQQCYLVNDQSPIMKHLTTFQCYQCRAPGCYDFMDSTSGIKVDKNEIEEAIS
jgi:hypothetical protein